jgi:hypothetical protein
MENISWSFRVRNEELRQSVKEERREPDWIGHIRRRNCLLKHVIGGKKGRIGVDERRGRRRKQLLDDHQEKRGYRILKEEALDSTVWRTSFGRDRLPDERTMPYQVSEEGG